MHVFVYLHWNEWDTCIHLLIYYEWRYWNVWVTDGSGLELGWTLTKQEGKCISVWVSVCVKEKQWSRENSRGAWRSSAAVIIVRYFSLPSPNTTGPLAAIHTHTHNLPRDFQGKLMCRAANQISGLRKVESEEGRKEAEDVFAGEIGGTLLYEHKPAASVWGELFPIIGSPRAI